MQTQQRAFRDALSGFCTGVTVVTTVSQVGVRHGITASSFNSVSLDPPLILFSLDRAAYSLAEFEQAGFFAVNVLARDQDDLCARFAEPLGEKWAGIAHETWQTGAPILPGCVSNFECSTYAVHDGGDHRIFVGEVLRMATRPELSPMIYYRGGFHGLLTDD